MKISVISDSDSWMNDSIPELLKGMEQGGNSVTWIHEVNGIPTGELLFLLGCGQLIPTAILRRNKHNLVVHESALPKGKGWSPLTWQILDGVNNIPILLLETADKVDSGMVYIRDVMHFKGTELIQELRDIQAEKSIEMCLRFVKEYPDILTQGVKQSGKSTYYSRRTPADSELDPDKTIREQFNLFRVVDNDRYPAFFDILGERYIIKIAKKSEMENFHE